MAFSVNLKVETDEEATDRLASTPEGSISWQLSRLPVRQRFIQRGQPLFLPRTNMTVVPFEQRRGVQSSSPSWACIVIGSCDDRYPVGGHDLAVSEDELRRAVSISVAPVPHMDQV